MADENKGADLFDLLDKELDDIADLPSFAAPETGLYKLSVQGEMKELNKKPALTLNFVIRELVELANPEVPEEERAKPGDKFGCAFMLKNDDGTDSEMGWGKMKEFVAPFAGHFGTSNVRELVKKLCSETTDITAVVKKVERKKEKGTFDARVSDVVID